MRRAIFSLIALNALAWAALPAHAQLVPLVCDADNNGVIDKRDVAIIMTDRNTAASGPTDPRDPNRDGVINVLDARFCATQCTINGCAVVPSPPPPIANAGRDQVVSSGATVQLNGTGSTSARGDAITFLWSIVSTPSGSAAALSNTAAPRPTFVADQNGLYQLQLIVTDAHGVASLPSLVNIAAGPGFSVAPVANAGTYPIAAIGTPVTLDGSQSTDVSGAGPLIYSWSINFGPAGTNAYPGTGVDGIYSPTETLTPDLFGQYYLQLTVTDSNSNSASAKISLDTQQHYLVPVADAGKAQVVQQGNTVQLDGSHSFDPDGSSITGYQWTLLWKPPGSTAQLAAATSAAPGLTADQPGDYIVQLVVTANGLTSVPSTVLISTNDVPPAASAGADQTVYVGDTATVNGTGTDATNAPLTYRWSLLATPVNTGGITLNGAQTPSANFVPDTAGTYVAQLVVNNGQVDSIPAVTHIHAVTPTTADLALAETASPASPPIGGTVQLVLTATDLGPLPATSASVTDVLPPGLAFVSANGGYNPSTGIWNTGQIPRNTSERLVLTATVLPTGSYTNSATITASTPADPNSANNSASVTLTPVQAAILNVSAAASNPHPLPGSSLTFTVTVTNSSGVAATGTDVTDLLPSGFTFVSATTASGSYNSSTGQWNIGSLAAGGTATLTITATVNSSGVYTNTATAAATNSVSGQPGETSQVSVDPPPTVSITTPTDESRFVAPASFNLGISASSPSGVITQLVVYDGVTDILTIPVDQVSIDYSTQISGLAPGTHTLVVVAMDGEGASTTSQPVRVVIVSPTASASLLFPTQNAFFVAPATVTLLASAASSTGSVSRVEFFQNGVSVGTATEPQPPYSISLAGLQPGTYNFTVAVTDSTSTVTSSAVTVTVGAASTLTVTSPQPGASVASDVVAVSGTVQAPPNSSVTVGGTPATIAADGSFTANDIPLQPGANSIPVILTEPNGTQTTQTLSVTSTGSRPFQFSTYMLGVDSSTTGLPPLSVQFSIADVAQVPATQVNLSCFGDGTVNQSTSGLDTSGGVTPIGTCLYSHPGVYTAEATVIDSSSGQAQVIYTATRTIVVTDPSALDALLRSQWSGMNNALLAGDRTRALSYLDSDAQTMYAPIFSELASEMPGIVASYSDLTPVRQANGMAEYLLTRTIQGTKQAFIITFVNVEGVWQLDLM